jgi:hypothetical protein
MRLLIPQFESLAPTQPDLYDGLTRVVSAINSIGKQVNVDPNNPIDKPPAPDALNVTAGAGYFDVALTDNTSQRRGLFYFTEYDISPAFPNPTVVFMGATRNTRLQLGSLKLYWRAYSQYLGSSPSDPVVFGGNNPTLVDGSGAVAPAPQPSQGSGTGGGGFGEDFERGGCSEVGTRLAFYAGARPTMEVVPCSNWVDVYTAEGKTGFAKGTLMACFIKVEDLDRVKKLLKKLYVEGHQGGRLLELDKTRRSRRRSHKQSVVEPVNGTYGAGPHRVHNLKAFDQ